MFLTAEATAYLTLLYCACSRPWKAGKQPSTNTICLIKKLSKPGVVMHAFTSSTWEARLSAKQAMATCETLTENIHKLVKSNRVFHKSLVFIPILYLQVNPSE